MAARLFTGWRAGLPAAALDAPGGRPSWRLAWKLPRTLPIVLLLTTVLAACATPEQRAAQARADVEQMMAVYGPACTHLGYAAESDAWRSCVLNLSTKYDLQHYATSPGYYGWDGPYSRFNGWGPYW